VDNSEKINEEDEGDNEVGENNENKVNMINKNNNHNPSPIHNNFNRPPFPMGMIARQPYMNMNPQFMNNPYMYMNFIRGQMQMPMNMPIIPGQNQNIQPENQNK
jgi:hypothetical protein